MDSNETLDQIEENLDEEERILSETLKGMCDENGCEKNKDETAPILHQLGLLYMKRNHDKWSLVQSAALLQAAIIRKKPGEKETVKKDLQSLWILVLDKAQASKTENDLFEISRTVRSEVDEMRAYVATQLQKLPTTDDEQLDDEEKHRMEKEKIDDINTLQEEITKQYVSIMHRLSDYCVSVLGDPPSSCKFALVGMGSVARREVTPYSDFENVIVLEEGVQNKKNYHSILEYFRWFAVTFHIILITLGETFLPSVAIPSLNDYYGSRGSWFYDKFTPSGISFDGHRPHACKSPHGRQKPTAEKSFTIELIKPISKMIELLDWKLALKNGYHLGDILSRTSLVSGDHNVWNDFQRQVKEKLEDQRQNSKQFRKLFRANEKENEDIFNLERILRQLFGEKQVNIKRAVYRTITIYISACGIFYGIYETSCLDIVQEMKQRKLISESFAHKLSYAISVACEVRLKVYSREKEQDDVVRYHGDIFTSAAKGIIDAVGEKNTVDYFSIALSLQQILPAFIKSDLECRLLEDPNKNNEFRVFVYFFFGMCKKCIDLSSDQLKNEIFRLDVELRSIYLTFVGLSYFFTKDIQTARTEFELFLRTLACNESENRELACVNCVNTIQNCLNLLDDRYKKDKSFIDTFITMFKKMELKKYGFVFERDSVEEDNNISENDQEDEVPNDIFSFCDGNLQRLNEIKMFRPLHKFNVAKLKYTLLILEQKLTTGLNEETIHPYIKRRSLSSSSSWTSESSSSSSGASAPSSPTHSSYSESSTPSTQLSPKSEEDMSFPNYAAASLKLHGIGVELIRLGRYQDSLCEFQLAMLLWSFCTLGDADTVDNIESAKTRFLEESMNYFEDICAEDIDKYMKQSCEVYIERCLFEIKKHKEAKLHT